MTVTDSDREAADAWRRDWLHCRGEHTALTRAFAKHRTDSTSELTARIEALEGALEPFAKAAAAFNPKEIVAPAASFELPNFYLRAEDLFAARAALAAKAGAK